MPSFPSNLFIDPEHLPAGFLGFLQVCFLGAVYAVILMRGASMISDGSELLLLIPAWAPMVGCIVLPVLGAVPDGAVVLFSGLGPDAQNKLSVGVGALAGSTIMLLTVPWFLAQVAGRVNIDANGDGTYTRPPNAPKGWSKLMPRDKFWGTGVNVDGTVTYTAKFMMLTLVPYIVVQWAALAKQCGEKDEVAKGECTTPHKASLAAGLLTIVLFVAYLVDQARRAKKNIVTEGKQEQQQKKAIAGGLLSLRGVFARGELGRITGGAGEASELVSDSGARNPKFRRFLRPFFNSFDEDKNGAIDAVELGQLLEALGERPSAARTKELMAIMDKDGSGAIDFDEFANAMYEVLVAGGDFVAHPVVGNREAAESAEATAEAGVSKFEVEKDAADDADEDEEDEEVPADLAHLSPEEQRRAIVRRAFGLMGVGTLIVVLFSDPMVDVLSAVGKRTHIPAFYVSFVLAPLVSNGSELLAAYQYATKKTEKSIAISLATLIGSAIMNNTFCLAIFLFLVYFKKLLWVFTAEITAIIAVEVGMFVIVVASGRTLHSWTGLVVIALFPLSIGLVALLESRGLN